ncbi:hypothetical protein VPH35_072246 [Triticum aestivum]
MALEFLMDRLGQSFDLAKTAPNRRIEMDGQDPNSNALWAAGSKENEAGCGGGQPRALGRAQQLRAPLRDWAALSQGRLGCGRPRPAASRARPAAFFLGFLLFVQFLGRFQISFSIQFFPTKFCFRSI